MTQPAPAWMRVTRAQKYFDLDRSTLYRLAKAGAFKIYTPSRGVAVVKVAEVEAWIEGVQG